MAFFSPSQDMVAPATESTWGGLGRDNGRNEVALNRFEDGGGLAVVVHDDIRYVSTLHGDRHLHGAVAPGALHLVHAIGIVPLRLLNLGFGLGQFQGEAALGQGVGRRLDAGLTAKDHDVAHRVAAKAVAAMNAAVTSPAAYRLAMALPSSRRTWVLVLIFTPPMV